jgi:hypothetical protein
MFHRGMIHAAQFVPVEHECPIAFLGGAQNRDCERSDKLPVAKLNVDRLPE